MAKAYSKYSSKCMSDNRASVVEMLVKMLPERPEFSLEQNEEEATDDANLEEQENNDLFAYNE